VASWRDIHRSDPVHTATPTDVALLNLVKMHLRVDVADEDEWIDQAIQAALHQLEADSNRAVRRCTLEITFDEFPCERAIPLPRPPLVSVQSVVAIDDNGVETTFSSSSYLTDVNATPGRIVLKPASTWPSSRSVLGGRIRWTAGPATMADRDVQALFLLVGHWFEVRTSVNIGNIGNEIPMGYDALVERVPSFG
jgi:uncharacterized phiE125 gp8 family phage protein